MGSKKKAALHGLSKKERKALEKKAEALRAELAEREKAKAAKKGKKSKDGKPAKKGKAAKLAPVAEAESIGRELGADWFVAVTWKGDQLAVTGRIHYSRWQDAEGNDRYGCEIIAENVEFL